MDDLFASVGHVSTNTNHLRKLLNPARLGSLARDVLIIEQTEVDLGKDISVVLAGDP